MKSLLKVFSLTVFFSFMLLFTSCNNDGRKMESNLISVQKLITIPPETMRIILDNDNIPHGDIVFGYTAYKVLYKTKDDFGNEVIASGLLTVPVLPESIPEEKRKYYSFPVVLNEHGTIFLDSEAPSYNFYPAKNSTFRLISLFTGIYGFALAMPDYIGYGNSKGHYHPYMIKKSLAKSSIDMVKASINFCEENSIPVKRDVYITGYSEGGYAAMATAEKLQKKPEYLLNVKAAAPLDGVYDLETMGLGIVSGNNLPFPMSVFVGFLIYSYSETYLYDVILDEMLNSPYSSIIPTLFDGTKTPEEIDSQLPHTISELFKANYIQDFLTNSENPFRKKLRENNVDNWKPEFPVRIIHCKHDDVLPFDLAKLSYSKMAALGSKYIEFLDPEDVFSNIVDNDGWNHRECAPYAYQIAAQWFCIFERGEDKCK